jgi:uncharacterized DUF497 family protein
MIDHQRVMTFVWIELGLTVLVDKVIEKHGMWPEEVEEAFFSPPYKVRRVESGKYLLFGQSEDGRHIRIITARDMTNSERRFLGRK